MSATEVTPALAVRGLCKSFGNSVALRDVDLTIAPAEVHALVGQNGSGKSTLVKILAGFHQPDAGEAEIHGIRLELGDPRSASENNIRFVHQDLGLVDGLSAVENVALGTGYTTGFAGHISWRAQKTAVQDLVRRLGYSFDVRRAVGDLTASERVGVAIARALLGWDPQSGGGLLVLDEPTASMPAPEVERLSEVIRGVRDSGTSVLYVSHHFEEVFDLADSVTVFRDGGVVAARSISTLTHDSLIELMLGRRLMLEHYDSTVVASSAPLLETRRLAGRTLRDLTLEVRPGEVVGITGVTGSGREEVASLLFGVDSPTSGEVILDGAPVHFHMPADAIAAGIGLVCANRVRDGLLPEDVVRENMTVVDLSPFWKGFRLRRRAETKEVVGWIDKLAVHPPEPEKPILALSGGNQQKVLVARWLRTAPRVLVLDQPTQGVDVGSKADIHGHLRTAAESGMAVVVISTDVEELVHVCDRVSVIVDGSVSTTLSGSRLTSDHLHEAILGTKALRGESTK